MKLSNLRDLDSTRSKNLLMESCGLLSILFGVKWRAHLPPSNNLVHALHVVALRQFTVELKESLYSEKYRQIQGPMLLYGVSCRRLKPPTAAVERSPFTIPGPATPVSERRVVSRLPLSRAEASVARYAHRRQRTRAAFVAAGADGFGGDASVNRFAPELVDTSLGL